MGEQHMLCAKTPIYTQADLDAAKAEAYRAGWNARKKVDAEIARSLISPSE